MIDLKNSIPAKTLAVYQQKAPKNSPGIGTTNIPIDTPNFKGNRTPKGSVLGKYLQGNDGFDWGLFGSPLVARLPNGTLQIYDGGHRVAMLQQLYPHVKSFPGTIIDVKDEAEISRLFYRVNGGAASFVNPETRFINQVLGEENGIETYIDVLKAANVVVWESDTNFVPKSLNKPIWRINVGPLEDMVKGNKNLSIRALTLYTSAWGQFSTSGCTAITGQIVKALHKIGEVYQNDPKWNFQDFETWFINSIGLSPDKSSWLFNTEYKHDRMEKRHYGTALGIVTKYFGWRRANGKTAASPKKMEDLYHDYDKKKSEKINDQKTSTTTVLNFTGNTYDELIEELT
jgi:hypothetical protein